VELINLKKPLPKNRDAQNVFRLAAALLSSLPYKILYESYKKSGLSYFLVYIIA
jgi:hypothetical protein